MAMFAIDQTDCFAHINQDFLICTTVHKARNIGIFNAETYVRVSLEKSHKSTKNFPNSENPYFNEYFVFEMKCTLNELLRFTILYELKKHATCKKSQVLGELLIDLQSVWNQPNRCFFKKWGRLECPIGSDNKNGEQGKGFLQIDLAIVSQATNTTPLLHTYEGDMAGMNKWQVNQDYDDIENNLLQGVDNSVQCNIRYSIIFYKAYMMKKSDYIIQVSFHPFKGKTSVCKASSNPEWNYEISFAWVYPSLAQTFLIQILAHEHLHWKCVGEYEVHFDEIGFRDKPSLGPTYLHIYDPHNSTQYVGRLLIEIRSECFNDFKPNRDLTSRTVTSLDEKRWWQDDVFVMEFLALQGDFIHCNVSNCKLNLKLAEFTSNQLECFLKSYQVKTNTSNNLKHFNQEKPFKSIYLKVTLPDNRHKFDSDFFLHEILEFMKTEIETFKIFQLKYAYQFQMQTKCLKSIIHSILIKIKDGFEMRRLEYSGFKDPTIWDNNRLFFLQEYIKKLAENIQTMRNHLKSANSTQIENIIEEVLRELVDYTKELSHLLITTRVQDEWPDLCITINVSGNKPIAACRLNAKYFLNPSKTMQNSLSWNVRNFVFKDINCQHTCINCGCILAVIQGCLMVIVESERSDHINTFSQDWKQTEPFYWNPTIAYTMYKCRIFIHQAKVRPGADSTGLCDPYVRVVFGGQSADTPTEHATLSPIWNAVICFESIILSGSLQWYIQNPPIVGIELFDTDKRTADDYLGCGVLPLTVISSDRADANTREEPDNMNRLDFSKIVRTKNALHRFKQLKAISPPPLKWIPIALNGGVRAEVLLSGELVQLEGEINPTMEMEHTITFGIPNSIKPNMRNFVLEVVFVGFRNYTKSSGRHRIKVMMGDLVLVSGLSASRIKNCINFLVLYASGVVSLPEQLEYWPAIIATDVLVSGRGNESTIGAVLIPNTKRFLQTNKKMKCVPQVETDMESKANTTIHFEEDEESPLLANKHKKGFFERFKAGAFNTFKADGNKKIKYDASRAIQEHDYSWWTKFYNSMPTEHQAGSKAYSEHKHKLTIYSNELEKQSDLSYLTDWAEPVKMVHGVRYKKNAAPKEETYATLKLHLKITPCQCDANGGCGDGAMLQPLAAAMNPRYQAQLQALADMCKIIVRIYIVQGIQFRPHDKNSQSDSYVKITLGTKSIFNRAHYVPNQSNPVFGKCFQMEGVLPRDHMLEISVFDRNRLRDDIIGTTLVDLEDRWRTKHRATVGLPREYSQHGYNKWRDVISPFELLTQLCQSRDLDPPKFVGRTLQVDSLTFTDETQIAKDQDLQERLSLSALKNLEYCPHFGYKLMPEHVETRSLYRGDCPGIEQGKLQLWIELYEGNVNIPPPIDITPQPPQMYELRVVVLNCSDIPLIERNIFGKNMSDIYIKGWCSNPVETQKTDVHYRSMNGEGNFNWRMLFPIKYSVTEDMMVVKRKGGMLEEYETKQPVIVYLQVWDNDTLSTDDFLAAIEINLSSLPEPYAKAKDCPTNDEYSKFKIPFNTGGSTSRKLLNLFREKHIKGWLPLTAPPKYEIKQKKDEQQNLVGAGRIELELEIYNEAEAGSNPAGLGRNPPNALPAPDRPDTSFNPLLNPLKSLTKIIWPTVRKYVYIIVLVSLIAFGCVLFFAQLPYKIFGL
ncbi:otoferlin isoform X2 [Teleopsis dalmanni]|uniref:otoferlin isoform X2 n=3 Tax=Teleopsis dalmanni TaxID=139649 RepID=UPI0018CF34F5|nr:otoferlin isoform X2 [Teleopsis dalmanni]